MLSLRGRIRFGPGGDLYVATGEGQLATRSEDLSSLNGKILRLRPDGAVPPDNPFPGSPVWAYGLRNPEGLAWDSAGHLYVSDNGPAGDLGLYCHDELKLITKGGFYGWPLYAGNTRTSVAAPANSPSAVPPIVETVEASPGHPPASPSTRRAPTSRSPCSSRS